MVNNSTNINNHISPSLTEYKKTMTYDVWNPGPALGQAQKYGWAKIVNGIPTLPFW